MYGLIGFAGLALNDVGQLRFGVDAFSVRVAYEGVERGGSCSAVGVAHEEPPLAAIAA
jgi:hypothetical protein